jgi:hypothetical protein
MPVLTGKCKIRERIRVHSVSSITFGVYLCKRMRWNSGIGALFYSSVTTGFCSLLSVSRRTFAGCGHAEFREVRCVL